MKISPAPSATAPRIIGHDMPDPEAEVVSDDHMDSGVVIDPAGTLAVFVPTFIGANCISSEDDAGGAGAEPASESALAQTGSPAPWTAMQSW